MVRICGVEKLTGGRCLVTLEDGRSFPLYQKELDRYGIREEGEIQAEELDSIFEELLAKRVRLSAMNFLQKADRTEQQLRRKLETLAYPQELIDLAVDYVGGYRYIDDVRYAENYIRLYGDRRSLYRIEQELLHKGVSAEDISEAKRRTETPDEEQQIAQWLEKKRYIPAEADQGEKERMYRFLMRRGYRADAVLRALR